MMNMSRIKNFKTFSLEHDIFQHLIFPYIIQFCIKVTGLYIYIYLT